MIKTLRREITPTVGINLQEIESAAVAIFFKEKEHLSLIPGLLDTKYHLIRISQNLPYIPYVSFGEGYIIALVLFILSKVVIIYVSQV